MSILFPLLGFAGLVVQEVVRAADVTARGGSRRGVAARCGFDIGEVLRGVARDGLAFALFLLLRTVVTAGGGFEVRETVGDAVAVTACLRRQLDADVGIQGIGLTVFKRG